MGRADRLKGMMIGLAVGDALGAPVEFQPPGSFDPVDAYRAGGPHGLLPGYWTDDTSMALCSAVSLCARGGFDPEDQLQRFLRWFREGYLSSTGRCFDIGNRTLEALLRYERSGELYAGEESWDSAGNGALMRLAPIVMHAHRQPDEAVRLAAEHALLTHGDPRCVESNRIFARLLTAALDSSDRHRLLAQLEGWQSTVEDVELQMVVAGSYRHRSPPQIRGSGYVIASLEAALWAFAQSDDFASGMLLAVNLGDDADTTGAIYGQLAGAFYGESAIPQEWRHELHLYDHISTLALGLIQGCKPDLPAHWW